MKKVNKLLVASLTHLSSPLAVREKYTRSKKKHRWMKKLDWLQVKLCINYHTNITFHGHEQVATLLNITSQQCYSRHSTNGVQNCRYVQPKYVSKEN
jgi:hypothetical protein